VRFRTPRDAIEVTIASTCGFGPRCIFPLGLREQATSCSSADLDATDFRGGFDSTEKSTNSDFVPTSGFPEQLSFT
jgi:hypothetical protein